MTATDIPDELASVIRTIEEGSSFASFEERQIRFDLHSSTHKTVSVA